MTSKLGIKFAMRFHSNLPRSIANHTDMYMYLATTMKQNMVGMNVIASQIAGVTTVSKYISD